MHNKNTSSASPDEKPFSFGPPDSYQRKQKRISKTGNQGRAYIQTFGKVPKAVCQFINEKLKGFHADTRHFFCHILLSSSRWLYDEGWVPCSAQLIRKEIRKANPKKLAASDLIEISEADRHYGLSRDYRIPDALFYEILCLTHENLNDKRLDLFSGKASQKRKRTKLNDKNNNPYPTSVRKAMKEISDGRFNKNAIEQHLDRLKKEMEKARSHYKTMRKDDAGRDQAKRAYRKAMHRYSNDARCYQTVLDQRPEPVEDEIYAYPVPLRPQGSGRVSHIGGGLQSCSREMKVAAYSGIDEVHNYDIKSSQAYILLDLLEAASLDVSWLREYLNTEEAKEEYASKAGLSVDAWKGCLYALFMGARLPNTLDWSTNSDVVKTISEEAEAEGKDLQEAYEQFRAVVQPFYKELKRWHLYLEKEWMPQVAYPGRGGKYVKNDTGSTLNVKHLKSEKAWKRRAKLAAFLLQGKEAAFIHALTILAPSYDYEVISNEHDGLVTLGEIPEAAVEQVKQTRSMQYVEMVEKSFL